MTDALLESKIRVPRPRRGHVDRARLREQLDQIADATLTLISAPAGFGKTTLVVDWLAAHTAAGPAGPAGPAGATVAWLSLDARDNDPAVFTRYLVAAVDTAAPGAGAAAATLLESAQAPTEAVLTTVLNELDARPDDVVLVLDDYHLIESPDVRDQVTFVLEHRPPQLHVVITSRVDPPLPLARWRARGELVEIRAADLRFSTDEAAAYLTDAMGLGLTANDVATLEERTEGWIAALQLAALSMQGRDDVAGFIAGFAGDDRYVVDYLVEEVLQRQPDDVRTFLLQTSILTRMEASLCDAVTGRNGSQTVLEALERANLFVVPLDDRRRAYRYHHLFGDVLHATLLDELPEQVPELHHRASAWHQQHGGLGEAVRHAHAGGDAARAADLTELALPDLLRNRQDATLRAWLEAVPDDLLRVRPVLCVAYAGSLMVRGELEGVEERLRDAEQWLGAAPGTARSTAELVVVDARAFQQLPAAIAVYRAGQARVRGDVPGTMLHARRVLELADDDDHVRRGSAAALLGLAHWTTGELSAARDRYADAVAALERAGHLSDALGCTLALADIELAQGRLRDAQSTLGRGLHLTTEQAPVRGTADMHVGLSRILRERNELDAARDHLRASEELGEHAGLPQNRYRWRVESARILQADGDPDGALELLEDAEGVFTTDFSPDVRPLGALRARTLLLLGRTDDAAAWARRLGIGADDDLTYLREFDHLTLARVLLAEARAGQGDRLTEATRLLDRLLRAAEQGERQGSVVEVLVLQALAHRAARDAPTALRALDRAVTIAEPEGYVRVFLDEGQPVVGLLRALAKRGSARPYVRRLLASAGGPVSSPRHTRELVEPLGARELDVLHLLGTDLSGPEIARELLVTVNTVRTHTKNIYAKLGVNNRRAAVRRALELGLGGGERR